MTQDAPPTSDPAVALFEAPWGPLAYVDEGPRHAPPVVMVHGIPGSVRDFRYLAPRLVPRVRAVRVDLPGFGGSAAMTGDGFASRARAVIALADHLGLARFGVLGHSMGGGTALFAARLAPERVSALALVASVGVSRHRGLGRSPRQFRVIAAALSIPILGPALVRMSREQYRRRGFSGADTMTTDGLRFQLRALAATDFGAIRAALRGPLPPTLVAYARDDHLVETRVSDELAAALPAARIVAFPDGGHNLQKTRAGELAQAVAQLVGA